MSWWLWIALVFNFWVWILCVYSSGFGGDEIRVQNHKDRSPSDGIQYHRWATAAGTVNKTRRTNVIQAFEEPVVSPLTSFSQTVELSLHKARLFPPMPCVRRWISSFESLCWTADEHMTLIFSQWPHMLYQISFKSAYNAYFLLGSHF